MRLALAYIAVSVFFELTRSHYLWTPYGAEALWPILGTAVFYGTVGAVLYLALEPFARRVWPRMFVGTSRLLSRPELRWKDPVVGRSVLVGLAAGALGFLVEEPLDLALRAHFLPERAWLFLPDADMLISMRQALAWTVWGMVPAVLVALVQVAYLNVGRALLKRAPLAVAAAAEMMLLNSGGIGNPVSIATTALYIAIMLAVVLRFGLLASAVAFAVASLGNYAITDDWGAWYSQGPRFALAIFAGLAAYGALAASARGNWPAA